MGMAVTFSSLNSYAQGLWIGVGTWMQPAPDDQPVRLWQLAVFHVMRIHGRDLNPCREQCHCLQLTLRYGSYPPLKDLHDANVKSLHRYRSHELPIVSHISSDSLLIFNFPGSLQLTLEKAMPAFLWEWDI